METLIKLNNQSVGRDKLARLLQYTCRVIWHQLETRNANKYSIDRIKNLELTLSSFRKILRLGRCIDFGYMAMNSMELEDPIFKWSLTISKLSNALFLYADHIIWLTRSGFLKQDTDKWYQTANKFWLLSIISNLTRDFYEILYVLQVNKNTLLKPSELMGSASNFNITKAAQNMYVLINCHKDVFIDTLKNVCDLFIPLAALGFIRLSPSTVGTLGAISSLTAIVTIVKPITKLVPA